MVFLTCLPARLLRPVSIKQIQPVNIVEIITVGYTSHHTMGNLNDAEPKSDVYVHRVFDLCYKF